MAPSKFEIYVDQSMQQPSAQAPQTVLSSVGRQPTRIATQGTIPSTGDQPFQQQQHGYVIKPMNIPRYIPEENNKIRFYVDLRKIYPVTGGEFSLEEIRLNQWVKQQEEMILRRRCEEAERRVLELEQQLASLKHTQVASNRLSIVPQSLQPAQNDPDTSCYEALGEGPSAVQDVWRQTWQMDKFTVPIDQSQYIRENVPTSTPTSKNDKRPSGRRMSRPSMAGSPTLKLSPITETSRDCNSKSSSSSSGMSNTPGTAKKPLIVEPVLIEEPDRPLDPNDPSTYRKLLKLLADPLDRRSTLTIIPEPMPEIMNGVCFGTGADNYLVDKELSPKKRIYSGQRLSDDSDPMNSDAPLKTICFRVDQPANDWLFYICHELHRRCQKTRPDIELSIMSADPAIIYTDGSILVDEYFRFVSLDDYFHACSQSKKPFPKSVAAYITLELIQAVRVMHKCDIIHMDIEPKNLFVGCPSREDIAKVDERTSLIKLLGFDHAVDTRLLPADFKFKVQLEHLTTCEMLDSKPWSYEVDWYGTLECIHRMFFLEEMKPVKEGERWQVGKQFKGFPTDVWTSMFDQLLNISDLAAAETMVDHAIDELSTWIKANISFVIREAVNLDLILEDVHKAANKSMR